MHFERDALVMLKVLPVFKHVTDAEFECALALVSVERVEVGVLGFPHVAVFVEVLLTATVGDLVPERGVCGQPLGQALPIPVTDRVGSVRVCSLWPVAHR
jgi:hypothetical protein